MGSEDDHKGFRLEDKEWKKRTDIGNLAVLDRLCHNRQNLARASAPDKRKL